RLPGFHRRALVGGGEGGEDGAADGDVSQVAFDDLALVAGGVSAEVAAHRVDGLEACGPKERGCAAAVLLGERRPSQIDAARAILAFPRRRHHPAYSTADGSWHALN